MRSSSLKHFPSMILLAGGLVFSASAQELDWSATRISLTAQWVIPQKEFGAYWNNGPAVGLLAEVPVEYPLSLAATTSLSWHSAANTPRKSEIPGIFLLQVGGGVALTQGLWSGFDASFSAILVNNTFILTGPAVRPGFENAVESEFGFSLSVSWTMDSQSFPPLSVMASYQPIFVGLEPVAVVSFGIGVRI